MAGFVDVSSRGFKATRKGGAFLKRFGSHGGVITTMASLMDRWDGLPVDTLRPDFEFTLTPGEWQSAMEAYNARWAKRLARIRK